MSANNYKIIKTNKKKKFQSIKSIRSTTLNRMQFTCLVRGTYADSNTATTGAGFSFFLNFPTYLRNQAGAIVQCTGAPTIFANEQKVFDEYKVSSLTLRYIPYLQAGVQLASYTTATGNSGVTDVAPSFDPTIIVGVDGDDSALFTSYNKALNSQGSAMHTRFGNYIKLLTRQMPDDPTGWLNLQANVPNNSTPPDPNNPAKLAAIKVWCAGYPLASTTLGTFVAEWMVTFQGVYTLS